MFIADLHIHSRYSRATSQSMEPKTLALWAQWKGIALLGSGDFTHPAYFSQLREELAPAEAGLFKLKEGQSPTRFMLTAEVSNIFPQGGRVRKVHTLIFAPSFGAAERINTRLAAKGNVRSDGRPIFGFPVKELVKIALDASPDCLLAPAHTWTPWFSVFGAKSGFDSLEECFEEESPNIYAIETGLSSDPAMNWRVSALDKLTLLSNSDAHSPQKLGREANVFDCPLDYYAIMDTIKQKDKERLLYTIEFFPQEGKYHHDGHRKCGVNLDPREGKAGGYNCPVCGRPLTPGVLRRVEELADRPPGFTPPGAIGVKHLIPLAEIIASVLGRGVATKGVQKEYTNLIEKAGPEMDVLLKLPPEELSAFTSGEIARAVDKARRGEVKIIPGHDGVFGRISVAS